LREEGITLTAFTMSMSKFNTYFVDTHEKSTKYSSFTTMLQDAAEITPTFQRGITNKWYEVSPKTFYFRNVDITKFSLL
jgi:hypothetical protein